MSRVLVTCVGCGKQMQVETGTNVDTRCSACRETQVILQSDTDPGLTVRAHCVRCDEVLEFPKDKPVYVEHTGDARHGKSWVVSFISMSGDGAEDAQEITRYKAARNASVSIVILAWNQVERTVKCLKTITGQTTGSYQLIVVDNGSTDGTQEAVKPFLEPGDIVIRNKDNLGFSKGCNQGLKLATGEFVLFLNNDTEITSETWLDVLADPLEADGDVMLTGAKACRVDPWDNTFRFAGVAEDPNAEYAYLEGWCIMGRREDLISFNGFDEIFSPAFCEDVDLSWRIKADAGKLVLVDPGLIHHGSQTSRELHRPASFYSEYNSRILYNRWELGQCFDDVKSVLVIRRAAVGDVLMTVPAVEAYKKANPGHIISYWTQCPQLLQGNPSIDFVLSAQSDAEPLQQDYDHVFRLSYEDEPERNAVEVMAEQMGCRAVHKRPNIHLPAPAYAPTLSRPLAAVHTGRSWSSREWFLDRWRLVARMLTEEGYDVVQLGSKDTEDLKIGGLIDARGCTWPETVNWLRWSEFFVGIDSGPACIAKALGQDSFVLYGAVLPATRCFDANEFPIISERDCVGCRNRSQAEFVECKHGPVPPCMDDIKSEQVLSILKMHIDLRRFEE